MLKSLKDFVRFGTKSKLLPVFVFSAVLGLILSFGSVFFALPYVNGFFSKVFSYFGLSIDPKITFVFVASFFVLLELYKRNLLSFIIKAFFLKSYQKWALVPIVLVGLPLVGLNVFSSYEGAKKKVVQKLDKSKQIQLASQAKQDSLEAYFDNEIRGYQSRIDNITFAQQKRSALIFGVEESKLRPEEISLISRYEKEIKDLKKRRKSKTSKILFKSKKASKTNSKDVYAQSRMMGVFSLACEFLIFMCLLLVQFFFADQRRIKSLSQNSQNKVKVENQSDQSDALNDQNDNQSFSLEPTVAVSKSLLKVEQSVVQSSQSEVVDNKVFALETYYEGNSPENIAILGKDKVKALLVLECLNKNEKVVDAEKAAKAQGVTSYKFYQIKKALDKKVSNAA